MWHIIMIDRKTGTVLDEIKKKTFTEACCFCMVTEDSEIECRVKEVHE